MTTEKHIKRQLIKFNAYGFLKNLRFFDPFLLLYLIENGFSYTQIGFMITIREVMIYIFEIPSGIIADQFGKRTELIFCFLMYIISFLLFYVGGEIYVFLIAFGFYGLGEAFRSGTHKAMIIDFLDYHNIKTEKSKIYGKTRSVSLIGSSVSSVLSVILIIFIKELRVLFLLAVIPYIIDMILIISYPNYLNSKKNNTNSLKEVFKAVLGLFTLFKTSRDTRNTILDSSLFNGIFKTIKDYLQYIFEAMFIGVIVFANEDIDTNLKMILGLIYAVIFIISSISSKNAHRLKFDYNKSLPNYWLLLGLVSLILSFYTSNLYVVISLFLVIYIIQNLRKPVMVEKIGDVSSKDYRASVLSVESQMTSVFVFILAPLFGFIIDQYGFNYVFIIVSALSFISYFSTKKIES